MSFDADAILRQLKPEKHRTQVQPGNATNVVHIEQLGNDPVALVPDTMVYVGFAGQQDTSKIESLIGRSIQYHSIVALSELLQGVAQYNPSQRDYKKVRRHYSDLIRSISRSRVITPDEDCWMRAGVIAGTLTRTQGFDRHRRKELYADALIYLSATKLGLPVLTRNVKDFCLIGQVQGGGRIIGF